MKARRRTLGASFGLWLAMSLLLASAAGGGACGESATGGGGTCGEGEVARECTPGTEVFCKCRGGQVQGTQTCSEDGQCLGACTTPDGPCPEIPGSTSTSPTGICTPDEVITCTCDDGTQGTKTCSGDGLSFTDCTTPDGACGSSQTGTKELYVACADASECLTGVCDSGYCTRSCESWVECTDDAKEIYGDCAVVPVSGGGSANHCVPYCISQEECESYGPESSCSGVIALDDPMLFFAACAFWGDQQQGMPQTLCDSESGEVLYLEEVIPMECDLGAPVQTVCAFDECIKGCYEDADCPNLDCTSAGENLGCCEADPDCN
jgi:hypothetical protein